MIVINKTPPKTIATLYKGFIRNFTNNMIIMLIMKNTAIEDNTIVFISRIYIKTRIKYNVQRHIKKS